MINLIYKQGFKLSLRYITSAMKSGVFKHGIADNNSINVL